MKRVTIEQYVSYDPRHGMGLGTGPGRERLEGVCDELFGAKRLWAADVAGDVFSLVLQRGTERAESLLVKVVKTADADELLCPWGVILADDEYADGEIADSVELICRRRDLKDGHVWLKVRTPDGAVAEAVVVLDPTFQERQPEHVAAGEVASGTTGARYWQLIALWSTRDPRTQGSDYTNEVVEKLLELAAI